MTTLTPSTKNPSINIATAAAASTFTAHGGLATMGTMSGTSNPSTHNAITGSYYTNGTGVGAANPWVTTNTGPYTVSGSNGTGYSNIGQSTKIKLDGPDADIVVNGQSLSKAINSINERLAILTPNPALEEEFEELKLLAIAYAECEQRMLEKKRVFDILKNTAL